MLYLPYENGYQEEIQVNILTGRAIQNATGRAGGKKSCFATTALVILMIVFTLVLLTSKFQAKDIIFYVVIMIVPVSYFYQRRAEKKLNSYPVILYLKMSHLFYVFSFTMKMS